MTRRTCPARVGGALRHYEVVKQDVGDEQRWLVDRFGPILSPLGPQVRRECEQWATHEPPAA